MQHQPKITLQADGDAFADPPYLANGLVFASRQGRIDSAQQEGASKPDTIQSQAHHAFLERFDIDNDVWELWHGHSIRAWGFTLSWAWIWNMNQPAPRDSNRR